jgi:hypothetical protein
MSEPVVVERALLTASHILGLAGEVVEQRKALRLLADIQAGETIEDTLTDDETSGPGRFGVDLVDSAVFLAVYAAAQAFWSKYIDDLIAKGAEKASTMTVELFERLSKKILHGSEREKAIAEMKQLIEIEAKKNKIDEVTLSKLLEAVDKLDGA